METPGAAGSPADRRPVRRAEQLEEAANALDAERDVLASERDALKAALAKAARRSGYAVLPYKGPNGTWRRPIVLECTNGGITLQPSGQTFSGLELSPRIHPRSSPVVRAVAREMLHIRSADTPDGSPAVPYLVFLVRPNGVRPYYEARSSLEPLGIAFGYELINQDLAVDIPNLDNLATWDGSVPLDVPLEPAPRSKPALAKNDPASRARAGSPAGPDGISQGDRKAPSGWEGGLASRTQPPGGAARRQRQRQQRHARGFRLAVGPEIVRRAGHKRNGHSRRRSWGRQVRGEPRKPCECSAGFGHGPTSLGRAGGRPRDRSESRAGVRLWNQ